MGKGVLCLGVNKFIMKVNRQRNPYLKRIYSQTPHKYSFDIESGKYHLIDEQGTNTLINPNGTYRPKFRAHYSGFVTHKARYNDAGVDPSVLHFAPDPNPQTNYHNPVPDKFAGYAQFPYKLKPDLPVYLKKPGEAGNYPRKKAQSLMIGKESKIGGERMMKDQHRDQSEILQYTTTKLIKEEQAFFNTAWRAMSETKPLPKQKKRTCYNYKCKYMKQWVFDERSRLQSNCVDTSTLKNTLGRSYHEEALTQQLQESKLLSTMALTGLG